jgi:hypothetical protein
MGVPLILHALPTTSRIYSLLKSDTTVGTIFARLFNAGGGRTRGRGWRIWIRTWTR